jgi:hypothetical protein
MIKMTENTCYDYLCNRKPDNDNDYDYFILSITFLMGIAFIANI